MQTAIDATQKETAIDQQQHSCGTLICQHHQTILRLLSSAATASTRWRVREPDCPTTYKQYVWNCRETMLKNNRAVIYISLSVWLLKGYCLYFLIYLCKYKTNGYFYVKGNSLSICVNMICS